MSFLFGQQLTFWHRQYSLYHSAEGFGDVTKNQLYLCWNWPLAHIVDGEPQNSLVQCFKHLKQIIKTNQRGCLNIPSCEVHESGELCCWQREQERRSKSATSYSALAPSPNCYNATKYLCIVHGGLSTCNTGPVFTEIVLWR